MNTEKIKLGSSVGLDLEYSLKIPKVPRLILTLGTALSANLDVPKYSDLTLKCKDDEIVFCHKIILVYRLCNNEFMSGEATVSRQRTKRDQGGQGGRKKAGCSRPGRGRIEVGPPQVLNFFLRKM
jgi:hypothetical protein